MKFQASNLRTMFSVSVALQPLALVMPSNKMYDRLCSPKSFSGNVNRTFEYTQVTAGDYYHIPEARFSEAVCEYSFEWGLKAIKHLGIQKRLQPRKWGISLKISIFINIKKRYFSGASVICSWKFSPLLMTVLPITIQKGPSPHAPWAWGPLVGAGTTPVVYRIILLPNFIMSDVIMK